MKEYDLFFAPALDLFGEDAGKPGEETADAGRESKDGAEGSAPSFGSGEEAADAGQKTNAPETARKAGEETGEREEKEFEDLIRGRYRAQYKKRVEEILKQRLKGSAAASKRYAGILPVIGALARRYGVDPEDAKGIERALEKEGLIGDPPYGDGRTGSAGTSGREEPEESAGTGSDAPDGSAGERAKEQYLEWIGQAKELSEVFPSFDLERELADRKFRALLLSGVDVGTAFRVIHEAELLPQIIRLAENDALRRVADSVAAGGARPGEYGADGKSPGVPGADVSKMSKAQRDELILRAQRGEIIRF